MDPDLVTRARQGDREAFELIVRERLESCYAICLSVVGSPDDARDATQEAFIAAWRRLPRLRDAERFDGWLRQIAVNASRDLLRVRRRLREVPVDENALAQAQSVSDGRLDVSEAIDRLPLVGRQVAERRYLQGQPVRQISSELGLPLGTVKSRLFHGLC